MLPEKYNQAIKQLKVKLHHSFLEMSELQQLHQQDLDSQKHHYQQKIDELVKQNEKLKKKLKETQSTSQKNIQMIFDDIEDSFFQLRIKKDGDENYADQTFEQLLSRSPLKVKTTNLQQLQKKIRKQCAFIPNELFTYFQTVKQLQRQNARNKEDLLDLGKQYKRVLEQLEQSNKLVIELKQRQKTLSGVYENLASEHKKIKSELFAIQNERKHYLVKSSSNFQPSNKFKSYNRTAKEIQSTTMKQDKQIQKILPRKSILRI